MDAISDGVGSKRNKRVNLTGDDLYCDRAVVDCLPPCNLDAEPAALEECDVVVGVTMATFGAPRLGEMHAAHIDIATRRYLNSRLRCVAILQEAKELRHGEAFLIVLDGVSGVAFGAIRFAWAAKIPAMFAIAASAIGHAPFWPTPS